MDEVGEFFFTYLHPDPAGMLNFVNLLLSPLTVRLLDYQTLKEKKMTKYQQIINLKNMPDKSSNLKSAFFL